MTRDEMEARRLEAAGLLLVGISQADVTRRYGVSRTTVSRWARAIRCNRSLQKRKAPGRPPRLSLAQMEQLKEIWNKGPEAFGFLERTKWTCEAFRFAILRQCHIAFSEDHVGRIILKLGLRKRQPYHRDLHAASRRFEMMIHGGQMQEFPRP